MEWTPFKSLFWNTDYSIANLRISFTGSVSLWERSCYWFAWQCFTLLDIFFWIGRSILSQLVYHLYNLLVFIDKPDTFFPDILALPWKVIGRIVMTFSINVPYMKKMLTFYIILRRVFTILKKGLLTLVL